MKEKPPIVTAELKSGKESDEYGVREWRRM
jgi:hypothetical protein